MLFNHKISGEKDTRASVERARARKKQQKESKFQRSMRRKYTKKNRFARPMIAVMVATLVCILSIQIIHLDRKNDEYTAQQKQLNGQLSQEKARTTELKNKKSYMNSDEYVENTAKSKLGMVYKNEIIFKEK